MLKRREPLSDSNLLLLISVCIFAILYILAMALFGGSFLTFNHFFDLFNNNAPLIILACGLSIVMVGGGIDISVGGVTAMITMACAVHLSSPLGNEWAAMSIALCIGLAFGLVQGFLVSYLEIQPFIITLAGMFFAKGMTTVIALAASDDNTVKNINIDHEGFSQLRSTKLEIPFLGRYANNGNFIPAKIEIGMMVAVLVVIAVIVLLKWSRFGRNLYAVGGNKQSALMLGINVKRTKFFSYVVCGLLAGIAGFIYILKSPSGNVSNASGFEMKAIASSIIGGTMLTGGVGNIIGSPVGVLTLMTIDAFVVSSRLTSKWSFIQSLAGGVVLGLAILLQSVVLSSRAKGSLKLATPEWLKTRSKQSDDDDAHIEERQRN